MRRVLALGAVSWLAVRFLRRRRAGGSGTDVVVGYADGSTIHLEAPSAERDRLLGIARAALPS